MDKNRLLQKISVLTLEWNNHEISDHLKPLEEMERLFEDYLKIHPHDTDILKRLAMALHTVPLADDLKAIECLKKVIAIDPNDVYAFAALLEIQLLVYGTMDPQDCLKLYNITTEHKEQMSLVEYLKARYIEQERLNIFDYISCLEKSVKLCGNHVNNLLALARIWHANDRKEESRELFQKAYCNIRNVFNQEEVLDITSIERFIQEFVTGTRTNEVMIAFLEDEIKRKANL